MSFKKTSSKIALIYSAVYAAVVISEIILAVLLLIFYQPEGMTLNIILSVVPLYAVGFPLAVFMFKRLPQCSKTEERKSLSPLQFTKYFVVSYAFMSIGSILSSILQLLLSALSQTEITDPASDLIMGDAPKLLLFLSTVIIAPIGEELLFRYFPYKKISGYGDMEYVLFTALCFSFFHMNFFQGIYAFLVGLGLGMAYVKTRRLIYCILIHMLANFMGGILAPLSMENSFFSFVFTLLMISAIAWGLYLFVSYIKRTDKQLFREMAQVNKREMLLNPGMIIFFIIFIISSVAGLFV